MHKPAQVPNDLEVLFVERANAGDVEGLVALYEEGATLDCGDGEQVVGTEKIRELFVNYLVNHSQLSASVQAPALRCGNLALTSSCHSNGHVSAEIARRQPNGNWLWVVDQFAVGRRGK